MHYSTIFGSIALVASTVNAAPTLRSLNATNTSGSPLNVVYWGQNGGGTIENNDLSAYCTATSGIDILVLAFLYEWGNGNNIPSGTIGQSCFISTSGQGQQCDALASAIAKCQSRRISEI